VNSNFLHTGILFFCFLIATPVFGQEINDQKTRQIIRKSDVLLDRFSRKCERRTKKAERRFCRYEQKIQKSNNSKTPKDSVKSSNPEILNQESRTGLGKEPLLDSLRLIYGFADYTGSSAPKGSLSRAQHQLNATQRSKSELLQRKEYWKAQVKQHPEYGKWLSKMEKERYYYHVQISEYRKTLRDPSTLDDKMLNILRRDPRWREFAATLPAKPQNADRMQPRQLVQKMMQSQAAALDPEPAKLLSEAKKKGSDLLGGLSNQAVSFGNMDNAAQMPKFTPNPYKTKSFWKRIDVGFNLQFDGRTNILPTTGIAGVQASFNFDPKLSTGLLANYRFGMGEITNIRFSHAGAGYGAFANYKVWKMLGVQAGYERNRRAAMETGEFRYPASWTSSVLAGLTWEYGVGRKAKGTVGVFYDFLYQQHTPQTNAVLWRMGWKM